MPPRVRQAIRQLDLDEIIDDLADDSNDIVKTFLREVNIKRTVNRALQGRDRDRADRRPGDARGARGERDMAQERDRAHAEAMQRQAARERERASRERAEAMRRQAERRERAAGARDRERADMAESRRNEERRARDRARADEQDRPGQRRRRDADRDAAARARTREQLERRLELRELDRDPDRR